LIHFAVGDYFVNEVRGTALDDFLGGGALRVRECGSSDPVSVADHAADWFGRYVDALTGRFLGTDAHSADAVVERAESRLGEWSYDLFVNNCEHFAVWCKTGVSRSRQTEALFGGFLDPTGIASVFT